MEKARLIGKFGAQAVLGRAVLGCGEMRAMISARNVLAAYQSREKAKDPLVWEVDYPDLAAVLEIAETIEGGNADT